MLLVLGELGTINIRRAYGNWAKTSLKGWGELTGMHSIVPMQQFDVVKGKSATDMRMTIDAMDLLYRGHVDGFGIMSSDSDFLPLAQRIREDGLPVYGFGTAKTPISFQQACTRFFDVAALARGQDEALEPDRGRGQAVDAELLQVLGAAFKASKRDEDGYASLSELGPAGQGGVELRGAQLRLHAPVRPDQGGPQFRDQGRRGRTADGQAAALGVAARQQSQLRGSRGREPNTLRRIGVVGVREFFCRWITQPRPNACWTRCWPLRRCLGRHLDRLDAPTYRRTRTATSPTAGLRRFRRARTAHRSARTDGASPGSYY